MNSFISTVISSLKDWTIAHGFKVVSILIIAYLAHGIVHGVLERLIRKFIKPDHFLSAEAEKKREDTLIRVFHGIFSIALWVIVAMTLLSELGIDIGPLLAAAGIAGLALGFGGQYLIRDFIGGLFIVVENQYRIGDVVCLDSTCGLVEDITLRMTMLRDLDGTVHHIPNGEIKRASNLSKNFSRVNMNLGIAYNTDLEKAIEVINKTGNDLAKDPNWKEHIIKPIQFLRVDEFADSAIIVKVLGETKPLKQWDIAGEFRKRIKISFDKNGIEIPFPQRVIHSAK